MRWRGRPAGSPVYNPLDLVKAGVLEFRAPDLPQRFPLPGAGQDAARAGASPAIVNAANEVTVAAFLEGGC